jgi:hypothetical protein
LAAGAVLSAGLLAGAAEAEAQIYTRRNEKGVIEATNAPADGDYRLTYPGKGTLIHSRAYRLRPSYNGEFNHYIDAAAARNAVDVTLVRAIIQVESDFDHLAVSTKGAQGLMQLMPATARRFGVGDSFDPAQNIAGGVRYLRVLLDMFGGNVALAAAAYNAGENAVLRYGGIPPYRETRTYVDKVQTLLGGIGQMATTVAQETAAAFFAPDPGALDGKAPAALRTASRPAPARKAAAAKPRKQPSVFYRWKDESGVLHVGHTPPAAGITYTVIKGQD